MTPIILRGGTILTCDDGGTDHLRGDLLIEDAVVGAVEGNGAPSAVPPDTRVVDVSGCIVFPGLVDAHQHVWETPHLLRHPELSLAEYFASFVGPAAAAVTPDGIYAATVRSLSDALRRGTTTTFDWCHGASTLEHSRAALAAARESGARYLFGSGPSLARGDYARDRPHPIDVQLLAAEWDAADDRMTLVAALRGPDLTDPDVWIDDIRRSRASGLRISMHVGTHRAGPDGVRALGDAGLLGPDMQFVHVTDSDEEELRMIGDAGARIVVPPLAELAMGTGVPPLRRLTDAGVPYGLGIDTVLGVPAGMFAQLRSAAVLLRAADWVDGRMPEGAADRDILRAGTLGGARSCWLDDIVGSLEVGKSADLVVLRPSRAPESIAEAYAQVVWSDDVNAIESVYVAGRERFGPVQKEKK